MPFVGFSPTAARLEPNASPQNTAVLGPKRGDTGDTAMTAVQLSC